MLERRPLRRLFFYPAVSESLRFPAEGHGGPAESFRAIDSIATSRGIPLSEAAACYRFLRSPAAYTEKKESGLIADAFGKGRL